ncbi:hypothetical protein KO500_14950 [Cellulophaga baltica]|uniref:hypothetical protein n=1 Tax=Cellulophaga TaxID=104264 RepID=UPI001C068246|nr:MULTISPECIES: hypothetical protein [Cellulophaga]MBU2997746.1 hypothetical protein [Cellulophaga baltica]MDO6769142.1 hypothetical protein [Cellulophaga sp. 1_MG-2023]
MGQISLKTRVLSDIESLIAQSYPNRKITLKNETLHIAIIKKCYNATNVSIDYHRKRIEMDIVLDDTIYNPNQVNMHIPTVRANFYFMNLIEFLKGCIVNDNKSIAFYASLIHSYPLMNTNKVAI